MKLTSLKMDRLLLNCLFAEASTGVLPGLVDASYYGPFTTRLQNGFLLRKVILIFAAKDHSTSMYYRPSSPKVSLHRDKKSNSIEIPCSGFSSIGDDSLPAVAPDAM